MQDLKSTKIPPSIRFTGVHSDSKDPGYRYITFEILNKPQASKELFHKSYYLRFRQNETDSSKLEYATVEGAALYKSAPEQPYCHCPNKSWQHALYTTWQYYSKVGMSYCQKSVFSLTHNNGKLSVVLTDSDGGLHPPTTFMDNDLGERVQVYVMPAEPRPEIFEIETFDTDESESVPQLDM